jgi:ketosteroid isomerase-like protein
MSERMSGLVDLEGDTVRDFARYWEAVFNEGDYHAIVGYYTLDARLIAAQAETVGGHQAIERFWQDATEMAKAAGVRRSVQADEAGSDGELGYLRGRVLLARADQVTTVRYLTLWKRETDGRWRIAVDISSPSPQPA